MWCDSRWVYDVHIQIICACIYLDSRNMYANFVKSKGLLVVETAMMCVCVFTWKRNPTQRPIMQWLADLPV